MLPKTPSTPPDVAGPCPFCRRAIRVWWRNPPTEPGVFEHALPMCERFRTSSADDFVDAVIHREHLS